MYCKRDTKEIACGRNLRRRFLSILTENSGCILSDLVIRFFKSEFGLSGGDIWDKEVSSQLVELNCLYKEIEEIFHNRARYYDLSDSALWILYFLRESDKTYTQKEICEILSSSNQTVHSALKTLDSAGYIQLEPACSLWGPAFYLEHFCISLRRISYACWGLMANC